MGIFHVNLVNGPFMTNLSSPPASSSGPDRDEAVDAWLILRPE